ncbi:MAG: ABC transporter ATP-binding protein, partial [Myxococcota bacterium]
LPPNKATEARGHIGLLSHAALTYGELTAAENVAFYGRLYGADSPEKQARTLLTEFGLEDALDRQAKTFSRGMQQRLGLARALIGRPSLVLLDEPFSGLDRASTEAVIERIKQLRQTGAMILMISHDMAVTATLADEVAIMLRGRLAHRHTEPLAADALRDLYSEVTEATRRGSK